MIELQYNFCFTQCILNRWNNVKSTNDIYRFAFFPWTSLIYWYIEKKNINIENIKVLNSKLLFFYVYKYI